MLGTRVTDTILASVHVRARQQAGHMNASDLIKHWPKMLAGRRPSSGREKGGTRSVRFLVIVIANTPAASHARSAPIPTRCSELASAACITRARLNMRWLPDPAESSSRESSRISPRSTHAAKVCAGTPLSMIARFGVRPAEASLPTFQPAAGVTTSTSPSRDRSSRVASNNKLLIKNNRRE